VLLALPALGEYQHHAAAPNAARICSKWHKQAEKYVRPVVVVGVEGTLQALQRRLAAAKPAVTLLLHVRDAIRTARQEPADGCQQDVAAAGHCKQPLEADAEEQRAQQARGYRVPNGKQPRGVQAHGGCRKRESVERHHDAPCEVEAVLLEATQPEGAVRAAEQRAVPAFERRVTRDGDLDQQRDAEPVVLGLPDAAQVGALPVPARTDSGAVTSHAVQNSEPSKLRSITQQRRAAGDLTVGSKPVAASTTGEAQVQHCTACGTLVMTNVNAALVVLAAPVQIQNEGQHRITVVERPLRSVFPSRHHGCHAPQAP
jgi:hypothetical protein